MEENNHAKVMRCVANVDRMKKDFDASQGVRPTAPQPTQQKRPIETPTRPAEKLPKPEVIPSRPQPQTPQLRGNRPPVPSQSGVATAPPMRHSIPSSRVPPASPYVPPANGKQQESGGFLGSAVGFIAGSPPEEQRTEKEPPADEPEEESKKEQ